LYIGGPFGACYQVEWKKTVLVYQQLNRAEPTLTVNITPTPEAWKRFWKQMDEIQFWKWRDLYETKGGVGGKASLPLGNRL
jgi:hypothetical protein